MSNLNELRQKRSQIVKDMEALTAVDDWTDEQRSAFDDLEANAAKIDEDISRLEKAEARKAHLAEPAKTNETEVRIEVGDGPADKGFEHFGDFLAAVRSAGMSGGRRDERLLPEYRVSGASENVPSDGGFLVGLDHATHLMRMVFDESNLLSRCTRIPISGNSNGLEMVVIDETSRASGSRWGGIQIYRKPEGVAATAKKPKYAKLNWKLKKLIGLHYATDELEADAAAHAAIVQKAFAEEFAFVIDDEIFRGEGGSQMLGFTNADCFVSQAKEGSQLADTIVYENIINMYSRFVGSNGVWITNRDCFPQLASMSLTVGTAGSAVYLPPTGAAGAPYGTLLGMPVLFAEYSPTVGDANDIVLADLGQYYVIEKGGLKGAVSIHVKFIEDEMTYRWTLRNDGQPIWKSAVTPYKSSSTRSPFVGLAVRA